MTIVSNKRLVTTFNGYFEQSNIDAAMELLTDDAQWWVLGKPDLFPKTGTKSKAEITEILRGVHASLRAGMTMEVVGMVAEGEQVAAELHARAVTKSGRIYDNKYHMLYVLQDDRISAVREYTDLMNIGNVFDLPAVELVTTDALQVDARSVPGAWSPSKVLDLGGDKWLVADFLSHFARADVDAVLGMMAEDATWWANGRQDLYPGARSWTKAEMADVWHGLYGLLDGGLAMDPLGMVQEGNRIAAEVRSYATTKTGRVYSNDYHLLFTIQYRKIAAVNEYTDLLHAAAVFG